MSRLLIHLASGPEHPTRATLALLVGKVALDNGHDVDIVLVGMTATSSGAPLR